MNIALIGYGKMGKEIEQIAVERGHLIVAKFDIDSPLPSPNSPLYGSTPIDCCIDFSTASAVAVNVTTLVQSGIPLVIGTTGWSAEMENIRNIVKTNNGSVVYSSNFSLGANIMFRLVEAASVIFNHYDQYDISVHETHHMMKKDAPSGTALTIANKVLTHIDRKKKITSTTPSKEELFVSSSRVGTVVGEHAVRFNSLADDIVISHTAHNRSGFALGAVLAAEWIVDKKGLYSFEELLWDQYNTEIKK